MHDPFAIAISINLMEANLATFALYSGVNFIYGRFFCGFLASATAFKTSLLPQSALYVALATGYKWSDKGPFGSGTDRQ